MTGKPAAIYPEFPNNVAVENLPSGTGVSRDGKDVDDSAIDRAFAAADVVISQRMVNHRLVPTAIEPGGPAWHYEPGKGAMPIWSAPQDPPILGTAIPAP